MKYRVRHRSSYRYADPVDLSYHLLRLTPRIIPGQRVWDFTVTVDPAPLSQEQGIDYFGNGLTFLTVGGAHRSLVIETLSTVEVGFPPPADPATTPAWEEVRDTLRTQSGRMSMRMAAGAMTMDSSAGGMSLYSPSYAPSGGMTMSMEAPSGLDETIQAAEFTHASPLVGFDQAALAYATQSFPPGRPFLEGVLDLTSRIYQDFTFDPEATQITTPLEEVMARRRGVCQDFAHVEIAALRALGLPARYVSGYIRTYPPEGSAGLVGVDASHAWVSVYCPGSGWIDVDPTNDLVAGEEHILVAWGRDYTDVSPIRGVVLGGGDHSLQIAVEVTPIA